MKKEETQSKTTIYINNNILFMTFYESIQLLSSDAITIAIKNKYEKKSTLLINIYNTSKNN